MDAQFVPNQTPKWDFIKNQLSNRYSPSNLSPYILRLNPM